MTYTLTITTTRRTNGQLVETTETHTSNDLAALEQVANGKWWADTLITASNDSDCIFHQSKAY